MLSKFATARGYSLVEVVVVLTIMTIIIGITLVSFVSLNNNQALDKAAPTIAALLDQARSLTLASKNSSEYGVHFATTQLVLFKGLTYNSADPQNQIVTLNPRVKILSTALTGGGSDLAFQRLTGQTSQSGTVTVSLASDSSKTKTVTIRTTGLVEIN